MLRRRLTAASVLIKQPYYDTQAANSTSPSSNYFQQQRYLQTNYASRSYLSISGRLSLVTLKILFFGYS